MPEVVLTGDTLTLDELVAVARDGASARFSDSAWRRMQLANEAIGHVLSRGEHVYGLTTGVGAHKKVAVADAERDEFNRLLLPSHALGTGPDAGPEVVRATLLRLANQFAKGTAGVRPELAQRLLDGLARPQPARVRLLGSLGESDLAPMADLAIGVLGDLEPVGKETLALINNNAFSTAIAVLALHDCRVLSGSLEAAAALELEAFAANLTPLHPRATEVRPFPGALAARDHLAAQLEGSGLWQPGAARNLQDPLSYRCCVTVAGALRDALDHAERIMAIELNASQENPIHIAEEDRYVSVGNTDVATTAATLDYLRIALAPALTSAAERTLKLLQTFWSGLPLGLAARDGISDDALSEFGVVGVAIAGEARLLAQPVSYELVSSSIAEGIEDRMTFAPLAARRLAEMVALGQRMCAIELVVAAQALDLRRPGSPGRGVADLHRRVRELVPFTAAGEAPPTDIEPVRELVCAGLARPAV
jgi:histidine ammonia-lyase